MKRVIASAGIVALGAFGTQSTQAQMVGGADKPWSVSATLRGFYDDNYDTQPSSSPNGQNLRRGSYGFEIKPAAQVSLATGQTTLNAGYIYSYMYFADRASGKADQSHDFELFFNHNFNERYSVDLTDSFVIAQEPEIIDPNFSAVDRANGNNIRNSAAINFHAEITRLLSIVLGYQNNFYDYEQDAANGNTVVTGNPSYSALLDRMEQFAHIDTRWQLNDTTVGVVGYMFGAVTYNSDESIAPGLPYGPPPPGGTFVSSDTRNNYSHSIYVGVDHSFLSNLSFSGRVGVQILDYYNAPSGNPSSTPDPYVDLSLNWTYTDGGVLVLGFHNAHNQTDLGASISGANISVTEDEESSTLYLNVTQVLKPISPKLTANFSFQYQNSVFNSGPFGGEVDDFYLFGLNFTYQFNRFLSGEVGYNYTLLDSDVPFRGYDRNQVYIGLTASY
jgi:hypothetical protein